MRKVKEISVCVNKVNKCYQFFQKGKSVKREINIFCILIARFNLKKVDTVKALENIDNIPILFVHGKEDLFVPIMNTYTNYDKYKGYNITPKMMR